jgi:hypothetical protein
MPGIIYTIHDYGQTHARIMLDFRAIFFNLALYLFTSTQTQGARKHSGNEVNQVLALGFSIVRKRLCCAKLQLSIASCVTINTGARA